MLDEVENLPHIVTTGRPEPGSKFSAGKRHRDQIVLWVISIKFPMFVYFFNPWVSPCCPDWPERLDSGDLPSCASTELGARSVHGAQLPLSTDKQRLWF